MWTGIGAFMSGRRVDIQGVIDRKAMADRDAYYKLVGLVEMDDSYRGGSKPGKRGGGAAGKATVVVLVEDRGRKAGFAKMHKVEKMSSDNIRPIAAEGFVEGTVAKTDGFSCIRRCLRDSHYTHEAVPVGSGTQASKLLPWVHTLLANIKGNIRGVYKGAHHKHLQRYLDEFCYRITEDSGRTIFLPGPACVSPHFNGNVFGVEGMSVF